MHYILFECLALQYPNPIAECMIASLAASSLDSSLSLGSQSSNNNLLTAQTNDKDSRPDYNGLDFRLILDSKSGPPVTITLVASTLQEKAAWCSDIGQVIYIKEIKSSFLTLAPSWASPTKCHVVYKAFFFTLTLAGCMAAKIKELSIILPSLSALREGRIPFENPLVFQ